MDVTIVTPLQEVFSGEVLSVVGPGAEGEFGILPGHTPFLTSLVRGDVVVATAAGEERFPITDGFVEVRDDHVVVLAGGLRDESE
jgi:F-type H+-transporting ATPase subunit epsilon